MSKKILWLLAMLLAASSISLETPAHALPKFKLKGRWKLIKRRGKIKAYQMRIPGSRLIAVRGEAEFDAPISKIFYLLSNVPLKVKWVSRMIEARVIEKKSATHTITYTRFRFPWPIASRDFLTETKVFYYPEKNRIERFQYSTTHPAMPPRKGIVRAKVHYSRYIFTSLDNGRKTHLIAEGYGDPKGSIPAFIVNWIQRNWPIKSMQGLQEQLKKPFAIHHPIVQKLFGPKTSLVLKNGKTSPAAPR